MEETGPSTRNSDTRQLLPEACIDEAEKRASMKGNMMHGEKIRPRGVDAGDG